MTLPFRLNKYTSSFLALSLILWDSKGMFHSGIPIELFAATFLFLYWLIYLFTNKNTPTEPLQDISSTIIFLLGVQGIMLLLGLFVDDYDPLHFDTLSRHKHLFQFSIIAFLLGLVFLVYQYVAKKDIKVILIGLIGLSLLTQVLSVFCSATPGIDVYVMLQNAIGSFVHLQNPYNCRYADQYHGVYEQYYGAVNYMTYWPSNVYAGSIFYLIFGDFRYAYVFVCFCLIAFIYRHRSSADNNTRNILLFILLWLCNPVLIFNINRGWIDTYTTLPFFISIYYLNARKPILSGIFLGLVLSFKLYYLLLTPIIGIYLLSHEGFKKTVQYALVCGGVFLLTILPFLIINFPLFYQSTVAYYSSMKLARPDSLSWVSYLTRFNLNLVSAGTNFSLLVIASLYLRFIFSDKTIPRLLEFSAVALFIFFLCARQAFCNYYFFILFLFYMSIYFNSRNNLMENDATQSE